MTRNSRILFFRYLYKVELKDNRKNENDLISFSPNVHKSTVIRNLTGKMELR